MSVTSDLVRDVSAYCLDGDRPTSIEVTPDQWQVLLAETGSMTLPDGSYLQVCGIRVSPPTGRPSLEALDRAVRALEELGARHAWRPL